MGGFLFYNSFYGYLAGIRISGSIGNKTTFIVRHGKQLSYPYFVPTYTNTTRQQQERNALRQAVLGWQSLTQTEKETWQDKRNKHKVMSGYNFYISKYIKNFLAGLEVIMKKTIHTGQGPTTTVIPATSEATIQTISTHGELLALIIKGDKNNIRYRIYSDTDLLCDVSPATMYADSGLALGILNADIIQVIRFNATGNIYTVRIKFDRAEFTTTLTLKGYNSTGSPITIITVSQISYNKII